MIAARPEEHRGHHDGHIVVPHRRSECCTSSFYTASYLFCETVSFAAFLSLAIGCAAFAAFLKDSIFPAQNGKNQKMSIFFQTYITLWVLHNLSYLQARHQLVYIYPLRARFGNQGHFCFKCNYPASISFFVLVAAYVNLFYQYSKLLCPWSLINGNTTDQKLDPSQLTHTQRLTSSSSAGGGGTFSDIGGVTTALFLLSLSTIEYLSARKLRWDFYLELSRMENPPVFRSCLLYMYAIISLSLLQLILTFLYAMTLLLWLLLCRLFQWHHWSIFLTTCLWSIVIGYLSFFVERQEPFPTRDHSRSYHIANHHIREYLMCGLYIPAIAYWFFRDDICISTTLLKNSMDVDMFNLFLLNVAVCIMVMVKYVALSSHSLQQRRDHHPGVRIIVQRNGQINRPEPNDNRPAPPPAASNNDDLLARNLGQSETNNNNDDLTQAENDKEGSTTSLNQITETASSKTLININTNGVVDSTLTMVNAQADSISKHANDCGTVLDSSQDNVSSSSNDNNDKNSNYNLKISSKTDLTLKQPQNVPPHSLSEESGISK